MRAILMLSAVPALAAPATAAKLPTMALANGHCDVLIIGGKDRTASCAGKLLNTIYDNGRVGFYFVTDGGAAITFSGDGSSQINPNPDAAVQPVDGIIFSYKGKTDRNAAVGTCRFTNPYKPPGTVECRAETQGGLYEAKFTTDGRPPVITRPK
ncbi:hypothetical protein [Methylobacterium amylolyticum]|uniref:hypothetical protein n=1 Tax=Methylobacterium sp. NEAU 140 TaxID=3064945 RepID=UPI00273722AA|nr:hypothetical protein [Methylobacterium sp. NEAU 140]